MNSILIFYGFSGSPRVPMPSFPGGTDYDKSYQLAAETLAICLKKLFPMDNVRVQQAWTKDIILRSLESIPEPIRQVHVVAHASSARLCLAYRYDGGARLRKLAATYNAAPGTDAERAVKAMRDEDALVAGFFANALEEERLALTKSHHLDGASWQIWGCYGGYSLGTFTGVGDNEIDPYLQRFNFGRSAVLGIAVDIAMSLGVACTAARDGLGLEFWHGTPAGEVVANDTRTPANPPFWLWPANGSRWVSFDPAGNLLPKPLMFGQPRNEIDLPTPQPPEWFTDLYWS